jgi:hypothetical protein
MSQTSSDPLRFLQILDTMDVPDRRKLLSRANIGWLQRNIRVRNADHPDLDELLTILRRLRKNRLVT